MLITESDLLDWQTIQHDSGYQRLFVERRYFRDGTVLSYDDGGNQSLRQTRLRLAIPYQTAE